MPPLPFTSWFRRGVAVVAPPKETPIKVTRNRTTDVWVTEGEASCHLTKQDGHSSVNVYIRQGVPYYDASSCTFSVRALRVVADEMAKIALEV